MSPVLTVSLRSKGRTFRSNFVFLQAPVLDLDIIPSNPDSQGEVPYGSDVSYDISILTIPRSSIVLEISRNGVPLNNDKRFEIIPM